MRTWNWLLLISTGTFFFASLLWMGFTAPDTVPGHFSFTGEVDRWDSKASFLGVMGTVGVILIVTLGLVPLWIAKIPRQFVNVGSRRRHEYWTAPQRRAELNHILSTQLVGIGSAALVLIGCGVLTSAAIARGHSVPLVVQLLPFGLFLAIVAVSIGSIFRRTRVPDSFKQKDQP